MKILLESHQLLTNKKTGVGYYEKVLYEQLADRDDVEVLKGAFADTELGGDADLKSTFSRKVLLKLSSYGIRVPAKFLWGKKDAYLFPDFFMFPSEKITILVIHDLTFIKNPNYLPSTRGRIVDFFFPGLATSLKRAVRYGVKNADILLTTSHAVKEEIKKQYDVSEDKFIVSGIPPITSSKKKPIDKLVGKKFIYYQATIEPRKNHVSLLEAFSLLPGNIKNNLTLVLGGKYGWKSENVMTEITKLQESGHNILQLDYVSDEEKSWLYENAEFYVQPSHYEGFGMPLLEAMSLQTPVICSEIPVFREVCGKAAIYFDKDNPKSISEAMKELLNNKSLQKELIKEGDKRVEFYKSDSSGIEELISRINT